MTHQNFILDVDFGEIKDPAKRAQQLISIPGVVDHGLFVNMAEKAFFGMEDGTIQEQIPQ